MRPLVATYRLQLRVDRDLFAVADLVEDLAELGISHVYLAPVLEAGEGSTHGYDVVDPTRVDPSLGGDEALAALAAKAHEHGLGIVVDVVPNHMAADPDRNPWWRDVLRRGRGSRYAGHLDITWEPHDRKLGDRVLLPVLGDHYGRVLERGELEIERQPAELAVRYFERTYPLGLRSCLPILRAAAARAPSSRLDLVVSSLDHLVPPDAAGDDDPAATAAILDAAEPVLAEALAEDGIADAVDAAIDDVNRDPDLLHAVLEDQHYRLARWQAGADEVGYRRFFDVSDLIAVRVEQPDVFADTHVAIARWVDDGLVDGLRVDHPDGLADPARYAEDLRRLAGDRWIVVEKILEGEEALPPWPVDGTTGYEHAAAVGQLLVDPDGYAAIAASVLDDVGAEHAFADEVRRAKAEVLDRTLAAELRRITDALAAVCEGQLRHRDFTRREQRGAVMAALASLPVYRTYVTGAGDPSAADRAAVDRLLAEAARSWPEVDRDLMDVVAGSLLGDAPYTDADAARFRLGFQQLSSAVMAKGKEDTALYRYPVVLALNEVGADPGHPSTTVDALHERFEAVAADHPATMLTASTHDSKRSDDVRARLSVLSEIPDRYLDALGRFRAAVAGSVFDDDPLAAVLCFQTMVGAHPLPAGRLALYLEKALREAGLRTSWQQVDADHEAAVHKAVLQATSDPVATGVVAELAADILVDGRTNSLAQRLLLLTAPGVPDLYQGSELWDLSLVDPDNRRPVDLASHIALLRRGGWVDPAAAVPGPEVLADALDPGTPKLALTARALRVRRDRPDAFGPGSSYGRLEVRGLANQHAMSFVRGGEVVVVVPRLIRRLRDAGGWRGTTVELPGGTWHDALTPGRTWSGSVPVADLVERFPVSLLTRRR